ncbi:hypothetical protein [Streptacidiphilus sp. P02-A3a]|uniref:hypothetical protein n=1 Tax=Streptacidiphilus sp. P02-A3a TaxID=2704468 RepID=UPI0015F968AE|nr:hypothetical protein [Streptacidiphilus sp. P02-A3a]QMU66831.1 hypothetical protein GXP74_36485 [Streptacidiphilus sp. P02-A3a]
MAKEVNKAVQAIGEVCTSHLGGIPELLVAAVPDFLGGLAVALVTALGAWGLRRQRRALIRQDPRGEDLRAVHAGALAEGGGTPERVRPAREAVARPSGEAEGGQQQSESEDHQGTSRAHDSEKCLRTAKTMKDGFRSSEALSVRFRRSAHRPRE